MRKIFLFMMVSVDGYFEGPNHDLSWHQVDEEFNEYAIEQTKNVGTLLFGRRTYELMRDYWPTEEARKDDPEVAELMNTTPKVVVSNTLKTVTETEHWKNVTLIKDNVVDEIKKLKEGKPASTRGASSTRGGDIAVYGSSNFCITLLENNLLDELRIMVNPVVVGKGTTLFQGIKQKTNLKLFKTKTFKNGNVLLYYKVTI